MLLLFFWMIHAVGIFTNINTPTCFLSSPFLPPPEGAVDGVNLAGLRVFTNRPDSFNAQACQQKLQGLGILNGTLLGIKVC